MASGVVSIAVVARYLGPDKFGMLNYAFSMVTLTAVFVHLGMKSIVVRELVKYPDQRPEIVGSAGMIEFLGSFFAISNFASRILLVWLETPVDFEFQREELSNGFRYGIKTKF